MPVHRGLIENFKLTSWIDASNAARLEETLAIFGYASIALRCLRELRPSIAITVALAFSTFCTDYRASSAVQAAQIPEFLESRIRPPAAFDVSTSGAVYVCMRVRV
jgi:hypothetical protein